MTLTRRSLLGVLAAGSAGGLTGRGAVALLGDREATTNTLTAGIVDIVVEHWADIGSDAPDPDDPDSVGDGRALDVDIEAVAGAPATRDLFRVSLPQDRGGVNNPARLWLRADCPARTTLAELLTVRLSYSDADGERGDNIATGSLREVASQLRAGIPLDGEPATLDDDCLTDELFVLVEVVLPASVGEETVSLALTLAAVQCRNTPADLNPFGATDAEPCPPGYSCDCCWAIGKIDVDKPLRAGETLSFAADGEGLAGYGLTVTAVDGKAGVAFELDADGDVPALPLCAVGVKGGPDYEHYGRHEETFGFDTTALDGATDGLVYPPVNDNNGRPYDISNIVVSVCAPELPDGDCPEPAARFAQSGNNGGGNQ